ncbi:MAG: hypothetical protein AMXMBFR33_30050 [Candidatus Xenobia bacterium]|jgi:hypothetical protein
MGRRFRLDLLVLLCLVAVLAYFLRPEAPSPHEPAADPDCDLMLMAVGELPDGLLQRLKQHVKLRHKLRVRVGLPYMTGLEHHLGEQLGSLTDMQIMPALAVQARNFGAPKIAITTLELNDWDALRNSLYNWDSRAETPNYDRIAFWRGDAALLSTHEMPSEEVFLKLLDDSVVRLCSDNPPAHPGPEAWSQVR